MSVTFEERIGQAAKQFAEQHLEQVRVNAETWTVEYREPATGQRFVMDYLHPEAHGGGIPRLRPADRDAS